MKLGTFGNTFLRHIETIFENQVNLKQIQDFLSENRQYKNLQEFSHHLTKDILEPKLVRAFNEKGPEPIEGLQEFIDYMRMNNESELPPFYRPFGVPVTGDLGSVAKILLSVEGLSKYFPYVTTGDGFLFHSNSAERNYEFSLKYHKTRGDQVENSYVYLIDHIGLDEGEQVLFIDDAANGVESMRVFRDQNNLKNSVVVGVTTGSSDESTLYKFGADIVIPNIGYVHEL
ncbi:MAG: hypothetical protein KKF89_02190 [Nanoarchaeota archaeon]|nr:hypothetical protein [Nanoarchaeota archaeon]MBU1854504.1 hypothetical protein [Nanoarchaeota archaeon]